MLLIRLFLFTEMSTTFRGSVVALRGMLDNNKKQHVNKISVV